MDYFIVLIPLIGLLWFLNLTAMLQKLSNKKDIHNQVVLGGFLTIFLILGFMLWHL
ncbi:hypothetical protein [Falsibacillus albus]|uniref:hypothetical protein n=1 Tax=Falsibacillus albus TaxID=2478915 RepID=UPI0018F77B43|nr:hypothetical protein [Falsibacillus albus]